MKAAYIEATGPPENIRYGDLPDPRSDPQQVLVRVAAVAVNPIDTYIRRGAYRVELPLPFIIGRDMTGVVAEVGSEVTRFKRGDRVWCNNQGYAGRQGTFAELVSIDERLLYALPAEVDPLGAVAVLHSGLTAVVGLFTRAHLHAGETIFISGGDGNVGTAVLQLAKAVGTRVAVTSGNPNKADWCRELGADAVIDYRSEPIEPALRKFAPGGVDIFWDAAGKPDLELAMAVLARRGRVVLMSGLNQKALLPVGAFYTHGASLMGFTVTDATADELEHCARPINHALASGNLRAKISHVLPLSQAAEAHRLVEQGGLFGKVVLQPDDA